MRFSAPEDPTVVYGFFMPRRSIPTTRSPAVVPPTNPPVTAPVLSSGPCLHGFTRCLNSMWNNGPSSGTPASLAWPWTAAVSDPPSAQSN